jgi:gamma-glutamylcyclotransferase (GGCT)/AIG2-like uncharacterized protein YtfP
MKHLFVYGTLLPGLAPAAVAGVMGRCRVVGAGVLRGRLFHLGAYPGCVLDGGCESVVWGRVLEVPEPVGEVLGRLDWYENFVASDSAGSLFVRTACNVSLEGGGQVEAWVYVYNRDVSRARLIESGRWQSVAGVSSQD